MPFGDREVHVSAGEPEPKGGGRELERIIFFSDAVFAIAITLIVLDIKPPVIPKENVAARLGPELWALRSGYFSYVLSFLVIGAFWAAHHRSFRYITGYDGPLIALNTLLLMCVAFVPFPTAVLAKYGDMRIAVVLYASVLAATAFFLLLIWSYACRRRRLVSPHIDPTLVRLHTIRVGASVLLFLLSIPVSVVSIPLAELCWLLTFVLPRALARVLV
jgi:uncharacterized membrane protein